MIKLQPARNAAAAILLLLTGCGPRDAVKVETVPDGAALWAGSSLLGSAPQTVRVPDGVEVTVRAAMPGYDDASIALTGGRLPPKGRVALTLVRQVHVAMLCRSVPDGAELFVDGEFRGRTPLRLEDMRPGTYELTFRADNRRQVTQTVEVESGAAETVVNVHLPSLAAGYYRQLIKEEPGNIQHYADLAHHHVLEHEFPAAMEVFAEGAARALANPEDENNKRLWSELDRVLMVQYTYGGPEDVRAARTAATRMLAPLVEKEPDSLTLQRYLILALDLAGERDAAAAAFAKAWNRNPNARELVRLAKQRGFRLP